VTGFRDDHYLSGEAEQGTMRLESNFVIYPRQHAAMVLPDPQEKIIRSSAAETVQGVAASNGEVTMYYFFGTPREIYAEFREAREHAGYPVFKPKYDLFGVGWEAFGALGWHTNQKTVSESVDRYIRLGYPLRWAVIGSGFWPAPPAFHETTSFGLFNPERYPDPKAMIEHFHRQGLKVLFGLRLCFITDGPFAAEGVKKGYFLKDARGEAKVFRGSWPQLPYYLLDSHDVSALAWYLGLVKRWTDVGVDGFKEDYYDFGGYHLRDDKVDPINTALMKAGIFVVERNGYLSSNGDLHRINDFNFDQHQDRGPVNALALAYAGLPLVYPDIVGGTFGEEHFNTAPTPRMEQYMMRNAQWASVHPSMAMGQPPWTFPSAKTGEVMLKAAQLHGRLQPYFYTQGVRFSRDGYPWTLTPLPVAFPDDPAVYGRENSTVRGYEWMIGPSLLAMPLYGDDFETAESRDVYLPKGAWMDYETGARFDGPQMLKGWQLPVEKTPLFVGGDGVLVEDDAGKIVARVYPLKGSSETEFSLRDGTATVVVNVNPGNWTAARVWDTNNGQQVPAAWVRHALQWNVAAGHRYEVR
jgi:alpha-glucosidase (family GH31 glycosyl hydrolase)